uniref:Uncharacterized LOC108231235 n=1 Tax=Kryptolebias marmoratus TaxID=37003 RepID=A0A3Q3B8B2_KRYMA
MILLWVTLLLFHQGYTLVPVTTVQLGEPVTFTCPVPEDKDSSFLLCWYKQNAGDSMKLIASLLMHVQPEYGPEFSASRINVMLDKEISNLTILRTVQGDEGMYHCAFKDWKKHRWHGNYLSLKGKVKKVFRTSSDPDRPGGSVSLQCSVLSDSDNKTCSGGLRVFWFRSRSDKSSPDIIYADGNRHDECEKKPDSQKRCVFSKNINSSDAETYYCAVATCGQIIFGKGIEINRTSSPTRHENLGQPRDCIVSKVALFYFQYLSTSQQVYVTIIILLLSAQNEDGQDLNYVALRFSGGKSSRGKKKKELKTEESVYSHVKI